MGIKVGLVMGSHSDWKTMEHAASTLQQLNIQFEQKVVSAHRTPDLLFQYAEGAVDNGIQVIIAGAGGAAHLPGMLAAKTTVPVIGVPVKSRALNGMDSLLSIAQMPAGIPVLTMSIGRSGATNAALAAASILALNDSKVLQRLQEFRQQQTEKVLSHPNPAQYG